MMAEDATPLVEALLTIIDAAAWSLMPQVAAASCAFRLAAEG
jgi:hypothetical protein